MLRKNRQCSVRKQRRAALKFLVQSFRGRCYHGRMDDFEKKWKRIQEQLRIQMSGDERPRVSSGRTLFGIQSEGEHKMEEFARQIEAEYQAREQVKENNQREL